MEKIALAKKIEFKDDAKNNKGLVIVEPLYPGYGNTIGNSLRRILLSSLPGAAVIGVKIKGAKHEFMALPGIKEDVVDIILNLKDLRLKILTDTDEVIKLELSVQKKGVVSAKDIKKNSQVEIVNPDLVLANITEATGHLDMDIYVANGRGYSLAEKNKQENKEVDYMEIDSIFSPIFGVSYKVENTRVGKMINWDKLIMEIETDGSILVQEAFEQSVKILVEQLNALIGIKESDSSKIKKEDLIVEKVEKEVEVKKIKVKSSEKSESKTSKSKK